MRSGGVVNTIFENSSGADFDIFFVGSVNDVIRGEEPILTTLPKKNEDGEKGQVLIIVSGMWKVAGDMGKVELNCFASTRVNSRC